MLRYFLKTPPNKKIYNFKKQFAFFIKNININKNLFCRCQWGNTKSSFEESTKIFFKSSTAQENIGISKPKQRL